MRCRTCNAVLELTPYLLALIAGGRKQLSCSPCQNKWKAIQALKDVESGIHLCEHLECPQGAKCLKTTHYHRVPHPKEGAAKRVEEAKEKKEKSGPRPIRARLCDKKISDCEDASCHHHRVQQGGPKKSAKPMFELVESDDDLPEEYLGVSVVKGKPIHTYTPKITATSSPKVEATSSGDVDKPEGEADPDGESVKTLIAGDASENPADSGGEVELRTTGPGSQLEEKHEPKESEEKRVDTDPGDSDSSEEEVDASESEGEEGETVERAECTTEEAIAIVATLDADPEIDPPPPRQTLMELRALVINIMRPEMRHHASFVTVALQAEEDETYTMFHHVPFLKAACKRACAAQREAGKVVPSDENLFKDFNVFGEETVRPGTVGKARAAIMEVRRKYMEDFARRVDPPPTPSVNPDRDTPTYSGERKTLPDIERAVGLRPSEADVKIKFGRSCWEDKPAEHRVNLGKLGIYATTPSPVCKHPTRMVNLYFSTGGQDMRYSITRWLEYALTALPGVNTYKIMPIEEGDAITGTRANTHYVEPAYEQGLTLGWKDAGVPNPATVRQKTMTMLQHLDRFGYKSTRKCQIFTELYLQLVNLPGVLSINVLSLTLGVPTRTAMASIQSVCGQFTGSKECRQACTDTYDNTLMYLYQQKLLTEAKMLDAMPPPSARPGNVSSGPPPQ